MDGNATVAGGVITSGDFDVTKGQIRLTGGGTGVTAGGGVLMYTSADHDTTYDFWFMEPASESLRIAVSGGTTVVTFSPTGDTTFAGNAVMASGKGIDFSANTNLAGMTSELLDDYEEGTFTPTAVSSAGTITTIGAVAGNYTKIGRVVNVHFRITITTNGTGAGAVNVTLPFTCSTATGTAIASGRDVAISGKMLQGTLGPSSNVVGVVEYDNSYPGADGAVLDVSITFPTST